MSKKGKILVTISALGLALILTACSNTYLGRYIRWNFPDVYDLTKFPSVPVQQGASKRTFVYSIQNNIGTIRVNEEGDSVDLNSLLKRSKTRAFIVLKNDTIIAEQYPLKDTHETLFKTYSMTKSLLSLLIGLAIEERKIKDVNDPIGNYLPNLKQTIANLTIRQCLLQTTRIKYDERYFPWSDEPRWYYTKDARALTRKIEIDEKRKPVYENVEYNVLLLGMVLEEATGKSISQYTEQKIWKRAGMEHQASFSIDSEETRFEKVGDGFNAHAMDLVRMGKLLLDSGVYQGQQIIPYNWIHESTSYENSIPSEWKNVQYNYLWWVKKNGDFYANGHFGQYIYISPRTKTVIVRLGEASDGICWWCVWPQVVDSLNK